MHAFIRIAAVFGGLALLSRPAHAYLDPGSGSMMVQLLLGAVAGALVTAKLYWLKIKQFFQRKSVSAPQYQERQDDR